MYEEYKGIWVHCIIVNQSKSFNENSPFRRKFSPLQKHGGNF